MAMALNRRTLLKSGAALAAAGAVSPLAWKGAAASERVNHALLVAVTDYPDLPPKASLIGPNNDALLVREFLRSSAPIRFEDENVAVLADGLENAASPTRDAIRHALNGMAGKVKTGDFVYLQFSGHGTQQPAMDPSIEPDGLDEIFLPRDTGMWTDRTKGVPNALIDKEIRDHLQAIRDKGAFVWAVFDCCHSGTMTRAVGLSDTAEVDRKVDFSDLGITEEAMSEAVAAAGGTRGIGGETQRKSSLGLETADPTGAASIAPGGMVAFFAAQNTETTPEMPLPRGAEEPVRLGLFTYTLFSKIAEMPAASYRQLGQAILQAYSADNRARPTPLFEGDLDRPVFQTSQAERIAQWPVKTEGGRLEIPAGSLHRLSKGAKLAILASPGASLDAALGYVEVRSAKNLTSIVTPVAYDESPVMAVEDVPAGAYARLTDVAIGLELVVGRPPADNDAFAEETALLNAALDRIVERGEAPVNLKFVPATEAADVKLAVMSEMDVGILVAEREAAEGGDRAALSTEPRLWMLSPAGELSLEEGRRPPSLPLKGADMDELTRQISENLVSIFRATSLARLSAASDYHPEEVSVGFRILRSDSGEMEQLVPGTVPVVHPDDQVHIEARNGSTKPVDINVLYIGSDYSIGHMYAERLSSGSQVDLGLLAFTDSSYGMERMVVVLSEALPQSAVEDLSFLEQVGVRTAPPAATRSVGGLPGFGDLLREVAAPPATRAAARLGDKSGAKGAVMIFPMETTPRG